MSYRFSSIRIQEIVQAGKRLSDGQSIEPEKKGREGLSFQAFVELREGSYLDLRFLGRAGVSKNPKTYDASLLIEQERVRGIGYAEVARQNFRAKKRIPAGWHENICDPSKPTNSAERNQHRSLIDFTPSDFGDFTRRAADQWKIDLGWEGGLL